MKKQILTILAGAVLASGIATSAHAAIGVSSGGIFLDGDPAKGLTSVFAEPVIHFNDVVLPQSLAGGKVFVTPLGSITYQGNGAIYQGTAAGHNAKPAGDESNYMSVPENGLSGQVTATLDFYSDYFGLYWGSIDTYNTIAFYRDGVLLEDYTGSEMVVAPAIANGDQFGNATNKYMNFIFDQDTGPFNEIRFTSTQLAFESDNHVYSLSHTVPEPVSMTLLGAGLLGMGALRRRRQQTV